VHGKKNNFGNRMWIIGSKTIMMKTHTHTEREREREQIKMCVNCNTIPMS
jgi:hypothetical protein